MKILAVESSAAAASAALVEDGKLVGEFFLNAGLTHSCTLMPMIASMLQSVGIGAEDVDLFAAANGPGSFTGVRIGVSTVKGMAQPLDKPCVGISTLWAMAHNIRGTDAVICCAMDARRRQVYNALFEERDGRIARITQDAAESVDDVLARLLALRRRVILVGDGAALCYEAMRDRIPDLVLAPQAVRFQRASSAALAVWDNMDSLQPVSAGELSISYLRPSQAERERKQKMEEQQL